MSASKSVVSLDLAGAGPARGADQLADHADRLKRRAERELAARHEAERLLESKSLELFAANQRLLQLMPTSNSASRRARASSTTRAAPRWRLARPTA